MKEQQEQPDCANHKKDLFGETDMKVVAEAIGDLHYETLFVLLRELSQKLKQDSRKDWSGNRVQLAGRLKAASTYIKNAYMAIAEAWQISKPFMKNNLLKGINI